MQKKHKLRVYYSKKEKDLMYYHPKGRQTSADGWYLNSIITMDFAQELVRRGYDITTLKFEISPNLDNPRFDCIAKELGHVSNV